MKKNKSIFMLTGLLLLFFMYSTAQAFQMVSVSGDDVNMRSGAGKKYGITWKLGKGFPLKVLRRSGSWLRVKDFEGSIGWVSKSVVKRDPHMIVKAHKKTKKRINVRSGPGLNNRIVAKAYYGVVFKTLDQKNGWAKVQHDKGVTGWVKRSLLWGY
jgi:SH3-like domain-containing protein